MNDLKSMLRTIKKEVELTSNYTGKNALDDRVMEAMKKVSRHKFIHQDLHNCAYDNGPLPIGLGQTISQPFIVAVMSDLLNTRPTDTILEIGAGSGYQSAILSRMVQQVYSVEIIAPLAEKARSRLKKMGYNNIEINIGDGYLGWPEHAPYDGIIVTAAAPTIPQPLIDQLKTGAKLVIPVGLPYSYQELMVFTKKQNGEIESRSIFGVSFVPLTGDHNRDSDSHDLNSKTLH